MNGDAQSEFLSALLHAGTFWQQTVPMFAIAGGLLAGGAWLICARLRAPSAARLRALARNDSGSAEAMDFVLTFPIVLFITFMFVQLLLGGHASLVVHYSAYSAARAARTAFFDMSLTDIQVLRGQMEFTDTPVWQPVFGGREGRAHELADTAARIALMNAVPSAVRFSAPATTVGQIMVNRTGRFTRSRVATSRKAAYAFAPANASVDVSVIDQYQVQAYIKAANGEHIEAMPVRASVTFRYPLVMPAVSRIFGKNGMYTMSAEVTLL
jgi:hypothetical protein